MRIGRWIVILSIIWVTSTVYAQDWTVWLYHPDDGFLLHLDANGTVLKTQTIPTADGYHIPQSIVFSHHQSLMATVSQSETSFQQRLTLYEVESEAVIFDYELPAVDNIAFNADDRLIVSDNAFSPSDEQFAFVSFIAGLGWTIYVVNTDSGEITYTLPFDHPQVTQIPYLQSADIPQIAQFEESMLGFYIPNVDRNPSPQGHSYSWFLIPDQVRETMAFPNANFDALDTGEIIYPLPNKRFASDNETIPMSRLHHNLLYVYQLGNESRYPSLNRPDLDLLQTWFIQGGERILIEAWEDDIRTRWLVYDRNGVEVRNLPMAGHHVTATQDGFLYLTELNAKTVLVHVNTREFETAGDTLWVDEGDWQIVGVTSALSDNLLPFAQLEKAETPPPFLTNDGLLPTAFPTPQPLVNVGREMQIQAFEDAYINLRDTPSTDGEVLALLENGLFVDILEGPVESGIYTWWKVRLSGRDGWLVEEVEDTQVLIPRKKVEQEDESS